MNISTPYGDVTLPDSVRTTDNVKKVVREYLGDKGQQRRLDISIRWDDRCKNGHNTLSLTATDYLNLYGVWKEESGGCLHGLIAQVAPDLAFALPYHLVSADGPMHYLDNTLYLAGDRDYNGTRAGEQRKLKGLPMWQLKVPPYSVRTSEVQPEPRKVSYEPVRGEGKARLLNAARRCLGATEEELPDEVLLDDDRGRLTEVLKARFPKASVHDIANATYHASDRDCHGWRAGEQQRDTATGLLKWRLVTSPFTYKAAAEKPADEAFAYEPVMGQGKERELDAARRTAVWPEATDEQLCLPPDELGKLLVQRLGPLMQDFKQVIERLGFVY